MQEAEGVGFYKISTKGEYESIDVAPVIKFCPLARIEVRGLGLGLVFRVFFPWDFRNYNLKDVFSLFYFSQ